MTDFWPEKLEGWYCFQFRDFNLGPVEYDVYQTYKWGYLKCLERQSGHTNWPLRCVERQGQMGETGVSLERERESKVSILCMIGNCRKAKERLRECKTGG